jgi:AcrR family transcriptional regulator
MPRRTSHGPSSERFITETLALIAEKGGSRDVNLREISRRVGCAHTNVYNYFTSLDDLMWAAYRRALRKYAKALCKGLDAPQSGHVFYRRMIGNTFGFAVDNPGLHRFISSDPMDPDRIPEDVIATVTTLKEYYLDCLFVLCEGRVSRRGVEELGNILLAYLDGETFNLINGRVLPDDDIVGRVTGNTQRLFTLLTANSCDGIDLSQDHTRPGEFTFPRLEVPL